MVGPKYVQYKVSVRSSNFNYMISNDITNLTSSEVRKIVIYDKNVEGAIRRLFPVDTGFLALEISEHEKTLQSVIKILQSLADLNVVKDDLLVAAGGGALQDLVTLAASIYMRGIRWAYLPTTLMSMLDSCIGGKSSINLGEYKNLVGNFYPPSSVYIDITFLKTLNDVDIACGLAEGVKICFAASNKDAQKFQSLVRDWRESGNLDSLEEAIFLSLEKKKWFIEVDEFDKKERRLLNFGHSFGHALEAATNFKIPHGIAVLIGMTCAINFSANTKSTLDLKSWISEEVSLVRHHLNVEELSNQKFLNALQRDKKNTSTQLCLILLDSSGILCVNCMELSEQNLNKCFQVLVETLNELGLSHEVL